MSPSEIGQHLLNLIQESAAEMGKQLDGDLDLVKNIAFHQGRLLAAAYGEPGYRYALIASRNVIAMAAGIAVVDEADEADEKLISIIEGALGMLARVVI
jgi:hypothetical protein